MPYLLIFPIEKPADCKNLLGKILGIDVVVDKMRDIFLYENVRIHLDEVKNLGSFFEFEAVLNSSSNEKKEYQRVEFLMKEFAISKEDLLQGSYRELVLEKSK